MTHQTPAPREHGPAPAAADPSGISEPLPCRGPGGGRLSAKAALDPAARRRAAKAPPRTVRFRGAIVRPGDGLPGLLPATGEEMALSGFPSAAPPPGAVLEWIHPQGRFCTVRFRSPAGVFRESFPILRPGA